MFTNGISRFVLVFGACSFLLVGTILDVLQTLVQQRAEHRNPYRVLILGSQDLAHSLAQILHEDPAYVVDTHSDGYADSIDPSYDIVVAAGTRDIPILQDIADTASIQ